MAFVITTLIVTLIILLLLLITYYYNSLKLLSIDFYSLKTCLEEEVL